MWVLTVNKKYLLSALEIKRVDGKRSTESGLKVTEDINKAYLFETEMGCVAMNMFLISIYRNKYEFGRLNLREIVQD